MSDQNPPLGSVSWRDLSVPDAARLRDSYHQVAGWNTQAVSMGDYDDYSMLSQDGDDAAGICHARGSNANIPPQWLIYITVDDVDARAQKCVELGGRIVDGPRAGGPGRFCIIEDPAGAVAALNAP
ncbi:MAG: VOC family protein [Planctomycetota bacterium]|jgi:predicted enzyme related to lactoylglutathione lyase